MNCQPGDMAIVTGGDNNLGKVVICIKLLSYEEHGLRAGYGEIWLIDRELTYRDLFNPEAEPEKFPWAPDKYLMPIRPTAEPVDQKLEQEA